LKSFKDDELRVALTMTSGKRVPARVLSNMLGIPEREARRRVETARRAGWRIVSDERGYWFAVNDDEYNAFKRRYLADANQRRKTIRMMDRADYSGHYGKEIGAKS